MDNHTRRLVDNKKVIILIDNVQRNILRKHLETTPFIRHHETDDITRTYN